MLIPTIYEKSELIMWVSIVIKMIYKRYGLFVGKLVQMISILSLARYSFLEIIIYCKTTMLIDSH
jgi:hypothetical protein